MLEGGAEWLVGWNAAGQNNLRGSWEVALSREDRWGNEKAAREGPSRERFRSRSHTKCWEPNRVAGKGQRS